MTLGNVVDQLKYGELRSIAVKDDNAAITSYVNLALQALYNRFVLKVSEYVLDLEDNITEYTLPADCMVLDSVWNEVGEGLTIDDPSDVNGVMRVAYDTIQVPNPVTGLSISLIYLPAPASITYVDAASLETVVPLPPQLLEPLLHYIGYRAHGSMDGNIKAENNTHYMRYEASCRRIEELGIVRKAIAPAHVSEKEHIEDTYLIDIKE
jgi:hypothetical protein